MQEMIGKSIAGYKIEKQLGQGGMGIVYLARGKGKQVVIKTILPQYTNNSESVRRFMREAETMKTLSHRNIIDVDTFGHEEKFNFYYLVIEYAEGGDLLTYLGNTPDLNILSIFEQIASGLDYLHKNDVIHRDLKPDNILVTSSGTAKISDFGLVKVDDDYNLSRKLATTAGTLFYMPREQFGSADQVTYRADLYAFAVIAYLIVLGRFPFPFENMTSQEQIITCIVTADPFRPTQINQQFPTALDDVMLMALAKDPQNRYPSAKAFVEDLSRALKGKAVVYAEPVPVDEVKPLTEKEIRTWARKGQNSGYSSLYLLLAAGVAMAGIHLNRSVKKRADEYAARLEFKEQLRVYGQIGKLLAHELGISEIEGFLLALHATEDKGESILSHVPSDIEIPDLSVTPDLVHDVLLKIQVGYTYQSSLESVGSQVEIYYLKDSTKPMHHVISADIPWDIVPRDIAEHMFRERKDLKFQIYPAT